jgi:hypothetical protein
VLGRELSSSWADPIRAHVKPCGGLDKTLTAIEGVKQMDTNGDRDGKVPYQLIPTNLPAAFASPPNEKFDPSSASSASRKSHGLL